MSPREVLVLLVAATAATLATIVAARLLRSSMNRWAAQLAAGLMCGTIAALAAAVPYVDVVPDAEETVMTALGAVAVAVVAAAAVVAWNRRGRRQVPRS